MPARTLITLGRIPYGTAGTAIGGGEPTFQPLFTYSLLRKCKESYIHTAVDTCGYTLGEEGLKVLEEPDMLLFDLSGFATCHKCMSRRFKPVPP